ncbi:MAG: hypothetical protein H7Y11_01965, partial [Armatimonadetes bacterium]|nr:hypothetical protein [Anaerolineae bacterium]
MSDSFKLCPICDARNPRTALRCGNCGTTLADVAAGDARLSQARAVLPTYDYRQGETDLYEASLGDVGRRYLVGGVAGLMLVMTLGLALIFSPQLAALTSNVGTQVGNRLFITNTPRPTFDFPSVTPGTPTLTPSRTLSPTATPPATATPAPCQQIVQPLEGLIAVVSRCGHRDLFVMTEVLALNNLDSAEDITVNQIIFVPWPTETVNPDLTLT